MRTTEERLEEALAMIASMGRRLVALESDHMTRTTAEYYFDRIERHEQRLRVLENPEWAAAQAAERARREGGEIVFDAGLTQ